MEISNLIPHIESLIFASDKPLSGIEITDLLNQAFGFMEEKIAVEQVDTAIEGIIEKYSAEFYPFEVKQSGGGWQFLTKKEYHKTVAQLNGEKFLKRLSSAALETLAIVAYKQPVTKGEVEAIRGVSSDYAVQKLLEKELIIITGRNEKLPGHPLVYATSKNFMDYFGINSAEDLPKIKEVLADQLVQPTIVNHTDFEQSDSLIVTDDGELIASAEEAEPSIESAEVTELNQEQTPSSVETVDDTSIEDTHVENLADEAVTEDYISDEIFATEADTEEETIEESLDTIDSSDDKDADEDTSAEGKKDDTSDNATEAHEKAND